ncbi:MAG: hypothetical protein ACI9G1_000674 [Pirellulaceae bacterium]|jgi:hypothetical protein
MRPIATFCTVVFFIASFNCAIATCDEEISFRSDVMAVFSKAGCNQGICHGNSNGKGGFRLSLRGEDAEFDYEQIVRGQSRRRIDLLNPKSSLLLQKPTAQVAHQGGKRFALESELHETLRKWIAAGASRDADSVPQATSISVAPAEVVAVGNLTAQLEVRAKFSDDSERDVTDIAVYEPTTLNITVSPGGAVTASDFGQSTVMIRYLNQKAAVSVAFISKELPVDVEFPKAKNYIDRAVHARLRQLHLRPSELCDDTAFLRRVFIDTLGILPTAEQARNFIADKRTDKRTHLVDTVLFRPEFAQHWALKWSDVLRNEEKILDQTGVDAYYGWMRDSIANDKPVNEFVRQLVTGQGSTYKNPESNFYRANRDPLTRGESAARVFLGYRLKCARCHNHPFDHWTQDDYYQWAALFARIDYELVGNKRGDKFDQHEFNGEQIVLFKSEGEVKNPRNDKNAPPKFLGSNQQPDSQKRLEQLGQWLTSSENRQFAKSQVNFVWYHLMGRGIVDPVDDFRTTNPPTNPALLDALADDFIDCGFQLRDLVRSILLSSTYQADSRPNPTNTNDRQNFSHALVRRLTAEQLLDAQTHVLQVAPKFIGHKGEIRAGQLPGVVRDAKKRSPGDRFLKTFGKPERLLACTCERSDETTLGQAFVLICGDDVNERLTSKNGRLQRLVESDLTLAEQIDELFWSALSRAPTATEIKTLVPYIEKTDDRLGGLQDISWVLLNAKEFIFRR